MSFFLDVVHCDLLRPDVNGDFFVTRERRLKVTKGLSTHLLLFTSSKKIKKKKGGT